MSYCLLPRWLSRLSASGLWCYERVGTGDFLLLPVEPITPPATSAILPSPRPRLSMPCNRFPIRGIGTVLLICFLAACDQRSQPTPSLQHTQTLADGRIVSLTIAPDELEEGRGFSASVGDLPIVAAPEALKHLATLAPLSSPNVTIKGPDVLITFRRGKGGDARFVELRIAHRFVQEVTTTDSSGKRETTTYPPAPMPSATISTQ